MMDLDKKNTECLSLWFQEKIDLHQKGELEVERGEHQLHHMLQMGQYATVPTHIHTHGSILQEDPALVGQ